MLSPKSSATSNLSGTHKASAFHLSWKRSPRSPVVTSASSSTSLLAHSPPPMGEEEGRPMKRVNSKDDCLEDDEEEEDEEKHDEDEDAKHSFTLEEIDTVLKKNAHDVRAKAMTALAEVHCSETLSCLFALYNTMKEDDTQQEEDDAAATAEVNILRQFVLPGAEQEISLPTRLRDKLVAGSLPNSNTDSDDDAVLSPQGLQDLKHFVLADLRFNPVLIKVLLLSDTN